MRVLKLIFVALAIFNSTCHAGEFENVSIVKAMVEAINNRNLEALDEFISPNVVRLSAATPGVTVNNLDEFKQFLESDFAAVPDSVMTIDLIFGNDNYVSMKATYAGTQTGQMGPFAPSGKRFVIPFLGILEFNRGKISRMWVEWDNINALSQLGHLSPPD